MPAPNTGPASSSQTSNDTASCKDDEDDAGLGAASASSITMETEWLSNLVFSIRAAFSLVFVFIFLEFSVYLFF